MCDIHTDLFIYFILLVHAFFPKVPVVAHHPVLLILVLSQTLYIYIYKVFAFIIVPHVHLVSANLTHLNSFLWDLVTKTD